ncbi:metallophosphoesterase [Sphingobacterium detergens]
MIRILHLTDFHLNNKTAKDWDDFLKGAFFKKLDELQDISPIDLVVFTGDMIDRAGSDFDSVKNGLEAFKNTVLNPILDKLKLDISKFIICPGNHDINRKADKYFNEVGLKAELNSIDKINSFTNSEEEDYEGIQRIKEYKDFEFDLYKDIENKLHSKFKFSMKLDINSHSIGISSINSSWRCYGEEDMKNLFIGENQLNDNYKFVKDCEIKIAILHHQLEWLSDIEAKVIKNHISTNYDIIFSGHVHHADVEYVQNPAGKSLRVVSPSGLNQIREKDSDYKNGFSVIDYVHGGNCTCHFFKYNHDCKIFVNNTDICDKGISEIAFGNSKEEDKNIDVLLLEEDFSKFLNDSGANFTHRSKTLTLDDIYVAPYLEQFSLSDEEEKGVSFKSENILNKILSNEVKNTIIIGEENSGKTSFCKKIFLGALELDNIVPLFIKGRDIKGVTVADINNLIRREFRKQYKVNVDLNSKNVIVIIDDFNNNKLPQKSKKNFVINLQSLGYQTVITWDEYFTLSEMLESMITTVEVYEILKFGSRKRLELIRKWIDLIEDEFEDDQAKEFQIKELLKIVNSVIGKNLIPSLPIYILTILQASELNSTTNFEQSTFGHYYDVLIRSALGQKIKANAEIEKFYSYLTELSFWLYNRETIEIDEDQFINFHKYFVEKYRIQLSFRDTVAILEDCNLIQKNIGLYKFKYKYIYFYFIGKYFSDNIDNDEDIKSKVTELSNKLYQTESANIYIFLSHHSKSKFIINQILQRSKELFDCELVMGFNSDINEINGLIKEAAGRIELDKSLTSVELEGENSADFEHEEYVSKIDTKEGIDSISKINKAFKTIEILGSIIKTRYASLTGANKTELIEELYKLGLRSVTFLFKTLLEGEDYIKKEIIDLIRKDPNSALTSREREELAKQFMFNLLYMVSYSIFKRISSSISSKDLEITFADVQNKLANSESGEKNNAISLIDMAVTFEFSKSLPDKKIKNLAEELKNNPLAFNILRRLGVNFMRMIPMKENEQQKASEILNISMKKQRELSGTSSIKK